MKCDLNVWNSYRLKAQKIGNYIASFKDDCGNILMDRKELEELILEITVLLQKSSYYLDKNGLKMPPALWRYDLKDKKTHRSSPEFAYGHLV